MEKYQGGQAGRHTQDVFIVWSLRDKNAIECNLVFVYWFFLTDC